VLAYALQVVAQFGRVVMRRGYGNHQTLANKWQEATRTLPTCAASCASAVPRC